MLLLTHGAVVTDPLNHGLGDPPLGQARRSSALSPAPLPSLQLSESIIILQLKSSITSNGVSEYCEVQGKDKGNG